MDPEQLDEKNNLVIVCLFETYLAKFILEHPEFYQSIYINAIDSIEAFLMIDLMSTPQLNQAVGSKKPGYDLHRHLYVIFSQLHECYPEKTSFNALKSDFTLPAADYFIKLIIDNFLTPPSSFQVITPSGSPTASIGRTLFSSLSFEPRRSPFKPSRSPLLFSDENRGVLEIVLDAGESPEEISTQSIGIVSESFVPGELTGYFKIPVRSARFNYEPNETSYVAQWLRKRRLPVISGSSGSTEGLINLFFPLCHLTKEEQEMMIFVQACNMVANGHHSFFEALLVANHLQAFELKAQDSLIDFYLQSIPRSIREHPALKEWMASSPIQSVLDGFVVLDGLTAVVNHK